MARSLLGAVLVITALLGPAGGLGLYTFWYARGAAYLSNDPAACANCHVMTEQYAGWSRSPHHAVATCNDCHTPHDLVGKWLAKANNGYHHSLAFTTGDFHEPIMIKPHNRAVTEAACRHCHAEVVQAIDPHGEPPGAAAGQALECTRCHASVGHRH
jgi:cytochrome c nitrite reductase small subunit